MSGRELQAAFRKRFGKEPPELVWIEPEKGGVAYTYEDGTIVHASGGRFSVDWVPV